MKDRPTCVCKLGDCIRLLSGGTPSKSKEIYWGGDIPWVSNKDMKVARIYDSEDHITELGAKNGTHLIPAGTILIVVRGMTLAKNFPVAMAMREIAFNQDLKAIEVQNHLNPRFLFYWFQGKEYEMLGLADEAAHGTKRIQTDRLLNYPIELPNPEIQSKIAATLSAYDDLIENNTRRIKILEEMAQALYREWFVNFRFPGHENVQMVESSLGMIPEGFEIKRLDQVVLFQNNGTEAGSHLSDRIYLPIDCIPRKSLAINEVKSWEEAQSSLHLFDAGDILFGAMRPYFHKVIVAPFKGVTRKTCFVFKSILPEYHAFAAFTLFQDSTISFANSHSKGATIPYAVWTQSMDSMNIVFPSIECAKKFEEIVSPMIFRIGVMYFQNNNLRLTRDLLLPKLISGELNVDSIDIKTEGGPLERLL